MSKTLIRQAIETFSKRKQIMKTIEEMSELTKELAKAIFKLKNIKQYNRTRVVNEYVDVIYTLRYVKEIFEISDEEEANLISLIESEMIEKINYEKGRKNEKKLNLLKAI